MLERHLSDKDLGAKTLHGILTATTSRVIIVERNKYSPFWSNRLNDEAFLLRAHGAAHERNHILSPALPELEDREESFYHNEAFSGMLPSSVQIKEQIGFPQARGEQVFLSAFRPSGICGPAASIGNKVTLRIVDRDTNTIVHDPLASMVSQPEEIDCGFFQATILGEVGVSRIKVLEGKFERWIDRPV